MDEKKRDILSTLLCAAVIITLVVVAFMAAGPFMQAEAKWKEQIFNRVQEMVQESGFSYNLSTPQYSDTYCKHLFCRNEEDWSAINASVQELLQYINQTTKSSCIFIIKIDTSIPSVNSGSITIENDILRIGIIRNTFEGAKVFDGIDIDY